jgi:hypothetical protein
MTGHRGDDSGNRHLFDNPKNLRRVIAALLAGCVLLLLAEFVVDRHLSTEVESVFGFYALFGLGAGAFLVLVAWGMRKLLMRSEDYYDTVDD